MTQDVHIAEDLQSRYNVAKAQLDLCPAMSPDIEDHWEATRFNCEEIIELIERVSKAEAEVTRLKEQVRRLTQPVSDDECARYGLLAYWDRPCEQAMNVDKLIAARSK